MSRKLLQCREEIGNQVEIDQGGRVGRKKVQVSFLNPKFVEFGWLPLRLRLTTRDNRNVTRIAEGGVDILDCQPGCMLLYQCRVIPGADEEWAHVEFGRGER